MRKTLILAALTLTACAHMEAFDELPEDAEASESSGGDDGQRLTREEALADAQRRRRAGRAVGVAFREVGAAMQDAYRPATVCTSQAFGTMVRTTCR